MKSLSESQKFELIRLLKDLAGADHNFNLQEANRIRIAGFQLDLTENKINEAMCEDYQPLKTYFDTFTEPEQQRFVYQQALWLLMADEECNAEEDEQLAQLRTAFQLDLAFHNKVKEWVQEWLDWKKRGHVLIQTT